MSNPEYDHIDQYDQSILKARQKRPWANRILRSDRPIINVILFLLTCMSTFFNGYLPNESVEHGLWYGGGIVSILLFHEMGHYLMCVRYRIQATLPFFIPFPMSPFGTMGAVIRMDSRMENRRILFDVGVAGPLAGLVVTIPAIYFGLTMSHVQMIPGLGEGWALGDSLLFGWLSQLVFGELPPGYDVMLHPLAYAGWAGLFVTALNLLPIGQLDGGHVLYGLLGERGQKIYPVTMACFALICIFQYAGWVLLILLLLWFGYRHPPTLDTEIPLDFKRKLIAYGTFLIFLVSFTPVPFKI